MTEQVFRLRASTLMVFCTVSSLVCADDKALPPAPSNMKLLFSEDFEGGTIERYEPTDKTAWKLITQEDNHVIALTKKYSDFKPPFRSPLNRSLVKDLEAGSFVMDIRFQSTIADYPHRSLCLFFGYKDDAHLYYVHFGKKTDDYANQIFIVNNEARKKISMKTTDGTPWTDGWHRARIVRNVETGEISVYFDDFTTPIMTATDRTFTTGRLGFGSFDDIGNFDDLKIYVPEK